jgi:hypothetical protein
MDPIGQAIYNYYFYADDEVIHLESNYTEGEELDPAHFFRNFDNMSIVEQKALELSTGKVLDIGAGAGCHTLELMARGLTVTALEKSELALKVMKHRGIEDIKTCDIFTYKDERYDTLLLLMNGAGIAGNMDGLKQLLKHFRELMNDGGQVLLDSSDISYLFVEDDGSMWIDLTNSGYYGEMQYTLTYKSILTTTFNWLFIDFKTLAAVAEEMGYSAELIMEGHSNDYLARLELLKIHTIPD